MKRLICFFLFVSGIALFAWGANLIHYNYTYQRDITFILKSGKVNIGEEITAHHSEQATKELAVHLSLIVLGVVSVLLALWLFRKLHNKRDGADRKSRGDNM